MWYIYIYIYIHIYYSKLSNAVQGFAWCLLQLGLHCCASELQHLNNQCCLFVSDRWETYGNIMKPTARDGSVQQKFCSAYGLWYLLLRHSFDCTVFLSLSRNWEYLEIWPVLLGALVVSSEE